MSRARMRALLLGFTAAFVPLCAFGQVQFPGNPTSVAQCDAARQNGEALARAHHNRGVELSNQSADVGRQRQAACRSGMRDYWGCIEPYDRTRARLHEQVMQQFKERDRIQAQVRQMYNSCATTARAQERHQNDLRNQREQAAARSEALRRQQQAELELANRRSAQQRNEPRVIAETQPSPFNPATRNEPRQVQTPDLAAQTRAEQQRQAEAARQQEAEALRNVANQVAAALTGDARRARAARENITGQAFNPEGHQDPRVNQAVRGVEGTNRAMNRGGPAVTQIQNDSLHAAGDSANNTLGQLDSALAAALPRRESSGSAIFQQAIAEQARPGTAQVPAGASPASGLSFQECQRRENASDVAAKLNAIPASDSVRKRRGIVAAADFMIENYRQCLPDQRAQQMVDTYTRVKADALRACQQTSSDPGSCATSPF